VKLKLFLKLVSVLFAVRVITAIFYLIFGLQVSLAGRLIPLWVAILGMVVDGYLSCLAWKFSKGKK
jgi:hypothetical protein